MSSRDVKQIIYILYNNPTKTSKYVYLENIWEAKQELLTVFKLSWGGRGNFVLILVFFVIFKVDIVLYIAFITIVIVFYTFVYSPGSCPWHLHIETSGYNKRPAMRGKWSSGQWRRWRRTQPRCGSRISAGSGSQWWWTLSRWCFSPAGSRSPFLWVQESLWPLCLLHLRREGQEVWEDEGGSHSEVKWRTQRQTLLCRIPGQAKEIEESETKSKFLCAAS